MRLYEVVFAHNEYGSKYLSRRVVVDGYAQEAIAKASKAEKTIKKLVAEEVLLIGEED